MHVIEQHPISGGCLYRITQVLPGEHRRVSDQLPVNILLLLGLSICRLVGLFHDLRFFIRRTGMAGTIQSLTRDKEGVSGFRGSLPPRRGDNGDNNVKSPPGPKDTKVPPDMAVTVGQRSKVVVTGNIVHALDGTTHTGAGLMVGVTVTGA